MGGGLEGRGEGRGVSDGALNTGGVGGGRDSKEETKNNKRR